MRIVIDARWYGPRVGGGGIGRYVAELVDHLQEIDGENAYTVLLRKENFAACAIRRSNWAKVLVDVPWYSLAEQWAIPRAVRAARAQLLHVPHWNVPLRCPVPMVVTIHDLLLLDDPTSARATTRGPLVHLAKRIGFRLALDRAIHASRHIIAVSQATRSSIFQHFRVAPDKVSVIWNGVTPPAQGKAIVLQNLGVQAPFVLHVGNRYPHKNLPMLLRAFALVHTARPHVQFVLAGPEDVFSSRLRTLQHDLGLPETAVRFVPLPTDDELGALYRAAAVLAYPSRHEGFGMPPLEAMACGTPAIVADIPALREVVEQYATLVAPDDEEGWAAAMVAQLDTPEDAVRKLQAQTFVARYDWEETARATQEVYLTRGVRRL